MGHQKNLQQRIKWLTCFFIIGLVLSGATAIPLAEETSALVQWLGAAHSDAAWATWLRHVNEALLNTQAQYPILYYGTDWLAFGHFMIALVFVGALINPVRNRWLFDFGLMACVLVIPFAFLFGAWRGIPVWWRLIDCSFGVVGFIPLWYCRKWVIELEQLQKKN